MNYTERIDDIQIRDITYFPGAEPESASHDYDIVKWYTHKPISCLDMRTGEPTTSTESCYSIARLVWDPHEEEYDLHSVGLRWLEEKPSDYVCDVILNFAKFKAAEMRALNI